ncbi:hypothetical protein Tco_1362668 [Tanacetum coccineum]
MLHVRSLAMSNTNNSGVDTNNGIYLVAYAIVEAKSKASWCWFLNLLGEDLENRYYVRHIHENMKSQFKGGIAKCDILLNNICEVFNRQLIDGRDQLIVTCQEYIREYLMKRIVVVKKVIAKTIGPLTLYVTALFNDGGSSQAGARQAAGARNVSSQATGSRNTSSQATGSSQPSAAPSTTTDAKNA